MTQMSSFYTDFQKLQIKRRKKVSKCEEPPIQLNESRTGGRRGERSVAPTDCIARR